MRAPMMLPPKRTGTPGLTPVEFNARSKALLSNVNPKLAELMLRVEAQHPDTFEISEGMRDAARQAQMVAEGKSQTMASRHLAGNAVDIAMIGPDGKPNWNFEDYRPLAATAKTVATSLGIPDFVWGGDWKTLKDGVHFQVGGPSPTGQAGLSFGSNVLAMPTTAEGIAGMYGGGGLAMGVPVDPFAASLQAQAKQKEQRRADEEEATLTRRRALLSGVGSMFA